VEANRLRALEYFKEVAAQARLREVFTCWMPRKHGI
jgi:hypothetical protein